MTDTDDLKPLLTRLLTIAESTARDVGTLKGDVGTLKGDVATLKGDVATLKEDVATLKGDVAVIKTEQVHIWGELKVMNTRLDGFEKRLDDQGRILAALVPTRLAAVPSSAAE